MWVLEAWKDAEKVWYPVVWEEVKDASNVIDYNIRPEQTKDMSAEINANNQTTTGMATVIPWVNAPKLIAKTSIVWIPEQEGSFYGTAEWRITISWIYASPSSYSDYYVSDSAAILSQDWAYKFTTDWKWIVFPLSWWYQIKIRYYTTWYWSITRYDDIYVWNTLIASHSWDWDTQTYTVNAKKWDTLWLRTRIYNWTWYEYTLTLAVMATITPK